MLPAHIDDLKGKATEWIRIDKTPATRQEIQALLDAQEWQTLSALLDHVLVFGTAGLRATMGAGYSRMNLITVQQATQGLVSYLLKGHKADILGRGVVIGHDHRHHSEVFAEITAKVFISRNIPVKLFKDITATPLVAYSTKKLHAFCGIMITASHNPKEDNGYKLYWENGAQLVSPYDQYIAASIDENRILWPEVETASLASASFLDNIMTACYFEDLKALRSPLIVSQKPSRKLIYTPMHGVGLKFAEKVFETFNFVPFIPTDSQKYPDADFPTVRFPNPEEKGAFDEAILVAERESSTIILSNDPDADRLSVAEKQPCGSWRVFTGDEVGYLLAYYLATGLFSNSDKPLAFINSAVSSPFLRYLVTYLREAYPGKKYEFFQDLTGFKFLANKAFALENQGYRVVLAYEEALGYMVGTGVLDKDGLSAMGILAELIHSLPLEMSLSSYLLDLYTKVGYVAIFNSYFKCPKLSQVPSIFHRLRTGKFPSTEETNYCEIASFDLNHLPLLSSPVKSVQDYAPAKMMTIQLENGLSITLRASGTEPKLKFYSQMGPTSVSKDPVQFGIQKDQAQKILVTLVEELIAKWIVPETLGITLA